MLLAAAKPGYALRSKSGTLWLRTLTGAKAIDDHTGGVLLEYEVAFLGEAERDFGPFFELLPAPSRKKAPG